MAPPDHPLSLSPPQPALTPIVQRDGKPDWVRLTLRHCQHLLLRHLQRYVVRASAATTPLLAGVCVTLLSCAVSPPCSMPTCVRCPCSDRDVGARTHGCCLSPASTHSLGENTWS